ncbi:AAA family ATPase [Streptomyces sp. NPDC020965]|uniref:AAA family ATPase n=1 Tax=Streptomyces sp. NPDC020965 TaxID=3365105 RepID=UPI0037A97317
MSERDTLMCEDTQAPPKFTGRRDELRQLDRARHDSMTNGLRRLVVTGEAGIGRTALLREFAAAAHGSGCLALELRCREQHRCEPWALTDWVVRTLIDRLPEGDARGPALREAHEVFLVHRAARPAGDDTASKGPRIALFAAVREAVARLTGTAPLVLTVDDADQGDPTSLVFLRHLVKACSQLPVVLVAATRRGEPPYAPAELAELLRDARRLTLEGLSEQETAPLLRALLPVSPNPATVATAHRLTVGNPFMLLQLARWIRHTGTDATHPADLEAAVLPAVAELVTGRLDRIAPGTGELAKAVAVAVAGGDAGADPLLVAHLGGLALGDTLTASDLLVRMRFAADDNTLRLRHPIVRNALIGGMTLMARNAAHLAAATYLHERHAPVERIAGHLIASPVPLAGSWPTAVLLRAARSAKDAGDDATAARCLEHAVQVASGDELREAVPALADIRVRADRVRGLDAAVATLATTADPVTRDRLLGRIGCALYGSESTEDEDRVLESVGAAVVGTDVAGWPALHRLLSQLFDCPPVLTVHALDELVGRPLPDQPRGTEGLRATVTAVGALCLHLTGDDPEEAVRRARWALDRDIDELSPHPLALVHALSVLAENGHHDEAATRLRRHEGPPHAWGHPLHRALLLSVEARIALAGGALETARQQLDDCLAGLVRHGPGLGKPVRVIAAGLLAHVLISQGDNSRARTVLRRHRCMGDLPPGWCYRDALLARARLRAADGDLPGSAADLAELRDRNETAGVRTTSSAAWRMYGVGLLHQTGVVEEARRLAWQQLRFADSTGSPRERGRALRVLGSALGGSKGEGLLRESARLLETQPGEMDLAYALGDLGRLLTRRNRPDEAVVTLTEAVRLAGRCGAQPLVDGGRQQLAAADERAPQSLALRGVLALTARERQILIDAMRGLTNERIATLLRITRRTVELHLSSAYRKLGISGRRDFPEVFRNPGLWALLTDGAPIVRQGASSAA